MTHVPFDRLNPPPPPSLSPRQYVAVQFKAEGRTYTYHNDGERLEPGQHVLVPTRGGAQQLATIESVTDVPPPFETKPIIGKHQTQENESDR